MMKTGLILIVGIGVVAIVAAAFVLWSNASPASTPEAAHVYITDKGTKLVGPYTDQDNNTYYVLSIDFTITNDGGARVDDLRVYVFGRGNDTNGASHAVLDWQSTAGSLGPGEQTEVKQQVSTQKLYAPYPLPYSFRLSTSDQSATVNGTTLVVLNAAPP